MSTLYVDGKAHQPAFVREDTWYRSVGEVMPSFGAVATITSFPYGLPKEDIGLEDKMEKVDMHVKLRTSWIQRITML